MWKGGREGSKNFWGNHLIFRGRGAQKGEIRKDSGGGGGTEICSAPGSDNASLKRCHTGHR